MTYYELDEESRSLIDRLNNLEFVNGKANAIQLNQIRIDYETHCLLEEERMREVDYPDLHNHIVAHLITSKYFLRVDEAAAQKYLVSDLIHDILTHIRTFDQQFNEFTRVSQSRT